MRLRPETCWLLLWLPPLAAQPAGAERWEEEAAAVSVSRCKALKEMDLIKASLSDCYCYNQNSQVKWKYIWSTVQVKIASSGLLSVVYITEKYNCQYPETILSIIKCMIHNFWTPEESNDITIIIHPYGETVCFSVKPARKTFIYTISVKQNSYVLTLGCVSFAVCYKHGPLVEERSVVLLAWLLRLLSLLLVYAGVSAPQFAYTAALLLILSSGSRHYLWSARACVGRKMKKWFTSEKPVVKFLTEDEYREQADAATTCSLEELRQACRSPGFPSWLAVSRLQEPKKFADFVLGGSHLSPEEVRLHEEQYGLGGAFLEEQLFNLRTRDSLPAQ